MSIGRRLVRLVRSNLNSLLDRTADWDRDKSAPIEDLSDDELEAELRRRQQRREGARRAADRAAAADYEREAWDEVERAVRQGSERFRTAGQRPSRGYQRRDGAGQSRRRRTTAGSGGQVDLARLYAQLECPNGADLNTVRKHYRQMMRKYHPDMHSASPDKQRLATDLTQKLTAAYNELRRALS